MACLTLPVSVADMWLDTASVGGWYVAGRYRWMRSVCSLYFSSLCHVFPASAHWYSPSSHRQHGPVSFIFDLSACSSAQHLQLQKFCTILLKYWSTLQTHWVVDLFNIMPLTIDCECEILVDSPSNSASCPSRIEISTGQLGTVMLNVRQLSPFTSNC